MSRSNNLYQLQLIDTEIDNSLARIQEIDHILADNQQLQSLQNDLSTLKTKQTISQKALTLAEHQVEDQSIKIDQNQKKLYSGSVTNPKELSDLQLEEASLKKYLKVLEDRQLEAMIEYDNITEEVTNSEKLLSDYRKKSEAQNEDLMAEKVQLQSHIDLHQEKKASKSKEIEDADLALYTRLRDQLGGIAVTTMINQSCSACGSNIPSAIEQEVKSPSKLTQCTTCSRILFHSSS